MIDLQLPVKYKKLNPNSFTRDVAFADHFSRNQCLI